MSLRRPQGPRGRRAPKAESITKGKRPMTGNVHPNPPVSLTNPRRRRNSDYSARYGFTPN